MDLEKLIHSESFFLWAIMANKMWISLSYILIHLSVSVSVEVLKPISQGLKKCPPELEGPKTI